MDSGNLYYLYSLKDKNDKKVKNLCFTDLLSGRLNLYKIFFCTFLSDKKTPAKK